MFDPWDALNSLTGWVLRSAPTPRRGLCDHSTRTITIDPALSRGQQRAVLTHELVHAIRGPVPRWLRNREEAIVREISARTLIDLPPLIDAVAWSTHVVVIADELDVDTDTVHTRAVTLDAQERAAIAARLNDIHLP